MATEATTLNLDELEQVRLALIVHVFDLAGVVGRTLDNVERKGYELQVLNSKTARRKVELLIRKRTLRPNGNAGRPRAEDFEPEHFVSNFGKLERTVDDET